MAGLVRHPIDIHSLEAYLARQVPQVGLPVEVKQFGFGQSNPTYQLTSLATKRRHVLRKKPAGKLLSKAAHKVEREYRIIRALETTDVPVPKVYCLCEDESVIGTPFYIMEFLDGRIFEDPAIPNVPTSERTQLWEAATQTLAKLHRLDYIKLGLHEFGKSDGFYNRQLATWTQICGAQENAIDADTGEAVGRIPHFEELVRHFSGDTQPRDRATLVHGDYKIDNLVFHPTEPQVIGILDWEMSTVGHPLSDLAGLLLPYYTARLQAKYFRSDTFLSTPGLPSPQMVMQWHRGVAGWDLQPDMEWAVAFAAFRSAAICQGIAARVATRQASSPQARNYADAFRPFAHFAWDTIQRKERGQGIDGLGAKL
ncbi:Acyl-CoA dehydrogenase family member 11 [Apiospora rasikravindrae]|uniref:Acyl-CoA dehydrogenase family member 11 n=1 Tax=Apiospora rasikravindrae TaxID=990691 RepID=A0ABR1TE07_9PEZI